WSFDCSPLASSCPKARRGNDHSAIFCRSMLNAALRASALMRRSSLRISLVERFRWCCVSRSPAKRRKILSAARAFDTFLDSIGHQPLDWPERSIECILEAHALRAPAMRLGFFIGFICFLTGGRIVWFFGRVHSPFFGFCCASIVW